MLTTAGEACVLRRSGCRERNIGVAGGASIRECPRQSGWRPVDPVGLERGHDKIGGDQHRHGLRNSSQMRFMEINGKWLRYCRASACARPAGQ